MDFMSAPSQEYGVLSSPLFLCAQGDWHAKTRSSRKRGSYGLTPGCRKSGEAQSRFAHTRFPLALLVQSQTRRGVMSKWYQVSLEGRDTKSERGSERKRCRFPLLHSGELSAAQPVPSAVCTQGSVHPAPCACCARWWRWRSRSTPRRIGDQLCELSGSLILPCHMLWARPFTHGVVARCSGDVPVQCGARYRACPVLCHHRGFPLGTETDPEWKCFGILYILEDFLFNNFVFNMVLFISTSWSNFKWTHPTEHQFASKSLQIWGKCSLCLQFAFLLQKLPSNINLYNSSKKKIVWHMNFVLNWTLRPKL